MTFDEEYIKLLKNILNNRVDVKNERTGHRTKKINFPHLEFDLSCGEFPHLLHKNIPFKCVAEEFFGF